MREVNNLTDPVVEMNTFMLGEELITPEIAADWLDRYRYSGQRAISAHLVNLYAQQMRLGLWAPTTIDFALVGTLRLLVNGYHRLEAIKKSGLAISLPIQVHRCRSMEEVRNLYGRLDRGKPRSVFEAIGAGEFHADLGLTPEQLRRLVSAGPLIMGGFGSRYIAGNALASRSIDVRRSFARDWAPSMQQFVAAVARCPNQIRNLLTSSAVLGVALVSLRYRPEKAQEFWRSIALNDALRRGSPEHTLLNYIHNNRVNRIGPVIYSRGVAFAWNAAYEGRALSYIRMPDPATPINIRGTPYDGRRLIIPDYARAVSGDPVDTSASA